MLSSKQKRLLVPSAGPESWKALLGEPDLHWKRGRSAMMAAELWETSPGLPRSVEAQLAAAGFEDCELLIGVPEWKTSLPYGQAPSQSDVFALVRSGIRTLVLCVEAKVNEGFDLTVEAWLQARSPAAVKRLNFLIDKIGADHPPHHLRYQLIHRTASACIEAERFNADAAVMMVQSFSNQDADFNDFAQFFHWLGVNDVRPGEAFQVPVECGVPLYAGWISEGGGDD